MGIKSFSKFLDEFAPAAVSEVSMSNFSGHTVAVDVSIYMHKYTYKKGSTIADSTKRFEYMNYRFRSHGVNPIYVFDGEPPVEKKGVLAKRAKRRARLAAVGDRNIVTRLHYSRLKEWFDTQGLDYICAVNDAEKACAWLCHTQIASAVFTDDYDSLAFGAPKMIRFGNKTVMNCVDRSKILETTGLTDLDFINFCILCGSEYTPGHFRYGYKLAMLNAKHLRNDPHLSKLSSKFAVCVNYPPIKSTSCQQLTRYIISKIITFLMSTGSTKL